MAHRHVRPPSWFRARHARRGLRSALADADRATTLGSRDDADIRLPMDPPGIPGADPPPAGHDWAPPGSDMARRMAMISEFLAGGGAGVRGAADMPAALHVDVSVEVALLARLHGTPVTVQAMPGDRRDRPHVLGHSIADGIIAAWPEWVPLPAHLEPVADRVHAVGGITRFEGRERTTSGADFGDSRDPLDAAGADDTGRSSDRMRVTVLGGPGRDRRRATSTPSPPPAPMRTCGSSTRRMAGRRSCRTCAPRTSWSRRRARLHRGHRRRGRPRHSHPRPRPFGEQEATARAVRRRSRPGAVRRGRRSARTERGATARRAPPRTGPRGALSAADRAAAVIEGGRGADGAAGSRQRYRSRSHAANRARATIVTVASVGRANHVARQHEAWTCGRGGHRIVVQIGPDTWPVPVHGHRPHRPRPGASGRPATPGRPPRWNARRARHDHIFLDADCVPARICRPVPGCGRAGSGAVLCGP